MKKTFKTALIATLPVLGGYLVLGFGFGIVLRSAGFGIPLAIAMSALIYAGSMQYVAVGLLSGGASLITAALTTLMVNARHIFYGVSMLDRYRDTGWRRPYLIFSLTDETYSLVCCDNPELESGQRNGYYLSVSALNHAYWVLGTALGAIAGSLISFNSEGIDFALTALFVTVATEQWISSKNHAPALIGLSASVLCLLVFGADTFLIPAMLLIALILCLEREETVDG